LHNLYWNLKNIYTTPILLFGNNKRGRTGVHCEKLVNNKWKPYLYSKASGVIKIYQDFHICIVMWASNP